MSKQSLPTQKASKASGSACKAWGSMSAKCTCHSSPEMLGQRCKGHKEGQESVRNQRKKAERHQSKGLGQCQFSSIGDTLVIIARIWVMPNIMRQLGRQLEQNIASVD